MRGDPYAILFYFLSPRPRVPSAPAASVLSAPRGKLPLDEWADGWYTEGNNRQGAYTDMIKILFICHGSILRSLEKACYINDFHRSNGAYYTTITPFVEEL